MTARKHLVVASISCLAVASTSMLWACGGPVESTADAGGKSCTVTQQVKSFKKTLGHDELCAFEKAVFGEQPVTGAELVDTAESCHALCGDPDITQCTMPASVAYQAAHDAGACGYADSLGPDASGDLLCVQTKAATVTVAPGEGCATP